MPKVTPPDFTKYKDTPHAILSKIDFPIYITTNYDKFMEEALKSVGRNRTANTVDGMKLLRFTEEKSLFENSQYKPTENKTISLSSSWLS